MGWRGLAVFVRHVLLWGRTMGTRVVVVEDDLFAAKIISFVLRDKGYDVTTVSSGRQSYDEIVGRETDLVLLDVNLPDCNGFDLCTELRSRRYKGPVIFLTGQCDLTSKIEGFKVGADDYLVKPYEPAELAARADSVVRRYHSADQQALGTVVVVGDSELSMSTFTYSSAIVPPVVLAPTEVRLLECLMRNSGVVLSRGTLIDRTWGYDFVGDTNRVDVYIRRLRNKIESNPAEPTYLQTVRGLGYVFRAGDTDDRAVAPEAQALEQAAV